MSVNVNENDIAFIVLVTGERLVAQIKTLDASEIIIEKPLSVQYRQGEGGKVHVGLSPWLIGADDSSVPIQRIQIITLVDADDNLVKIWIQNTGRLMTPNPTGKLITMPGMSPC